MAEGAAQGKARVGQVRGECSELNGPTKEPLGAPTQIFAGFARDFREPSAEAIDREVVLGIFQEVLAPAKDLPSPDRLCESSGKCRSKSE
jgi:hypothetical protein